MNPKPPDTRYSRRVTIPMPASLYDEIKLVCRATGVPISEFLRRAAIQRIRALDRAGTVEAEIIRNLFTDTPPQKPANWPLTPELPCEPPSDPPTSSSPSPDRSSARD